jgi:hypothetical protein
MPLLKTSASQFYKLLTIACWKLRPTHLHVSGQTGKIIQLLKNCSNTVHQNLTVAKKILICSEENWMFDKLCSELQGNDR